MQYKISIVNYLNSAPFVRGLEQADGLDMNLSLDHPSESARKLIDGEVDIALAPVAIIPRLAEPHIVSDYCIGCNGAVLTVKIFSHVPIQEVKKIYLDYQSETSVRLTKILCRDYWKIEPELVSAYPGFQKDIYEQSAGLIIGDRAIRVLGKYKYEIDLGEAWKKHTGRPFVFAVWLSKKPIEDDWQDNFNQALANGLDQRADLIAKYEHLDHTFFSVKEYLNTYIHYNMDDAKRKALAITSTWSPRCSQPDLTGRSIFRTKYTH